MTWDDDLTDAIDERGLGRRGLLRTAAGGFVLAASGLLLPAVAGEIAAREGALDGALGGRRGPDRRGRDKRKRRDHGDDKKEDKNPRGIPFRSTALTIRTKSLAGAYTLAAKYYTKQLFGDTYFPWSYERVANPLLDRLAINDNWYPRVGVLVSFQGPSGQLPDLFIDVRNEQIGYPRGAAYYRTPLDPTNGLLGKVLLREQGFFVNESVKGTLTLDGAAKASCTLKRLPDTDDYIEFELSVEVNG